MGSRQDDRTTPGFRALREADAAGAPQEALKLPSDVSDTDKPETQEIVAAPAALGAPAGG